MCLSVCVCVKCLWSKTLPELNGVLNEHKKITGATSPTGYKSIQCADENASHIKSTANMKLFTRV